MYPYDFCDHNVVYVTDFIGNCIWHATQAERNFTMALSGSYLGIKTSTLYQLLKYSIYVIILYNVVHFTLEDLASAGHRFRNGVGLSEFYDAFPQAIDSLSWFILLLMLELETWVIEDEQHKGFLRWSINGVAAVCYFFIVLAFMGYFKKLTFVLAFEPVDIADACTAVGTYLSYMVELDQFSSLTAETCSAVGSGPFHANTGESILSASKPYNEGILLGYTEVTNAATWMMVVLVLWIDVFLQLRGELTDRLYRINAYLKAVLYLILVAAAVIWGIYGNFMDFWDAFIWIVAFFFIEMNLLQWHEESEAQPADTAGETA